MSRFLPLLLALLLVVPPLAAQDEPAPAEPAQEGAAAEPTAEELAAQEEAEAAQQEQERRLFELQDQLERGDITEASLANYDEELWSQLAFYALFSAKYARARTLTQQILDHDPESIPGLVLMGHVHHRGEGNLPKALFYLQKAQQLIERRFGKPPIAAPEEMLRWHGLMLIEQAFVCGEMGRHEDKIALLEEHDSMYQPGLPAERGWPLMRLRRYGEARQAVEEALALEDAPFQKAAALTALCAIEAEQGDRRRGYEACLAAARHEREEQDGGPTPFTNAAEASLGMLKMDEAEKLILEASEHFVSDAISNPWLDLLHLYLAQGRTAESLDAVRRMVRWRNRQPAYMEEQNRAETESAGAIFLLVAGRADDAARITRRALERPDRTGFTSSEPEQMIAASAVIDSVAASLQAELLAEKVSYSSWTDALTARFLEAGARLRSWRSGREAAAAIRHERILVSTLRPYLAGSIELPEWLEPELFRALGPGVAKAALERARAVEDLEGAEGYFAASEAEIARLEGDAERALKSAEEALVKLPIAEALLRARTAAVGAWAAGELGNTAKHLGLLDLVMQVDPGTVRRLGLALPVTIEAGETAVAQNAADLLAGSPRFDVEAGPGFRLQVTGDEKSAMSCLLGPRGSRLSCAQVTVRAGEDRDALTRRLVEEQHVAAFAPRLDLTQADLRSLDGSPTAAGGRASEKILGVLGDLLPGD